jgi:hypothetical protein
MAKENSRYRYSGRVLDQFGTVLCRYWEAETEAPSRSKALSNLKYRFRKEDGRHIRLELPDNLEVF